MEITDIKPQVRQPGRISVFIDGAFAFGMTEAERARYGLAAGETITRELYDKIVGELILVKANAAAMRYLSYRDRSEGETRLYLSEKGFGEDVINKLIRFLRKYKYLDDAAFASRYAADSFNLKGFGNRKIAFELARKGVRRELIAPAIEEALESVDLQEVITKILRRRGFGAEDKEDRDERYKAVSYLTGRGFLREDIRSALEEYDG
ncbi:MAG: regulatory protein RecX [Clostridiales bacterium]|jgi:regulatory protein|nr:regulatory protein RecX [Clostridiales bacterium]